MTRLVWDQVGERTFETGVDHGVLYLHNTQGEYDTGVPWNGLTTVTESPSGADATPQYADNIKYLNLISAEQFGGTIEAFTYPREFGQCDGTAEPAAGVRVGQQSRKSFGLSYRTLKGNDTEGTDHGYVLHLVYGATAAPSEKAYGTVNDSPAAIAFSWAISTVPVAVPNLKPTALITVDSTEVPADQIAALEDILYGTNGADPRLPLPAEVLSLFDAGAIQVVEVAEPAYNAGTHTVTVPATTGVVYTVDGEPVAAGPLVITEDTVVRAQPAEGYRFDDLSDTSFTYRY